jgi:hypothetical protein
VFALQAQKKEAKKGKKEKKGKEKKARALFGSAVPCLSLTVCSPLGSSAGEGEEGQEEKERQRIGRLRHFSRRI